MTTHPLTLEELATWLDRFEDGARQNFEKDGCCAHVTLMHATRDRDGNPANNLAVLPWAEVNGGKEEVRAVQQQMVDVLAPRFVVNVSEGWRVLLDDPSGNVDLSKLARVRNNPKREEIIMLRAECRAGVIHRAIPIHRSSDAAPTLGETDEQRVTGVDAIAEGAVSLFGGYFNPPEVEA
jgi:hypothetical protein